VNDLNPVSPYLSEIETRAPSVAHQLVFAGLRKLLEVRDDIRIVIVANQKVPPGGFANS